MLLYGTAGATARLFTARLRGIAPRRRLAACAFFAHRGVCGGRGGFCGAAFDATRRYGLKKVRVNADWCVLMYTSGRV